jgi:6-phosphogluconolactonase/glucosamine-6-phosphate isomerase/deaminase
MKRRDFLDERAFYNALEVLVSDCTSSRGIAGMIIPGGSTPMPLYQRLFQHGIELPADFRFILSDERHCPVDSPDSNQGAIRPLLTRAGVAERQFIAPDVSLPVEECAQSFSDDLGFFLVNGGSIRTALLGVGSDGHTAGIFDESSLGKGGHASAVSRPDGHMGITCTPEFCHTAESIVFILRGGEKTGIVEKLMSDPGGTVAGRLGRDHPNVEIWFCSE